MSQSRRRMMQGDKADESCRASGCMSPSLNSSSSHVIIAGFGVPGRVVADLLESRGVHYCVIELNPATCERCQRASIPIHAGDVTNPDVLREAKIQTASMFVIAIPDEKAALEATHQARRLNPHIKIITRCHFTSTGFEARRQGADDVVIAEQVVAEELTAVVSNRLADIESAQPVHDPPAG
jgi:monovalent cation:H+ antiporter-2, CPA2 family